MTLLQYRKHRMLLPLLTVGWLVLLLSLALVPLHVKVLLHTRGVLHNAYHLVAFGVLTLLLTRRVHSAAGAWTVAVLVALLGFWTEWMEHWVWGPLPLETWDIAIDAVGALLGLLYWTLHREFTRMRTQPHTVEELARGMDAEG